MTENFTPTASPCGSNLTGLVATAMSVEVGRFARPVRALSPSGSRTYTLVAVDALTGDWLIGSEAATTSAMLTVAAANVLTVWGALDASGYFNASDDADFSTGVGHRRAAGALIAAATSDDAAWMHTPSGGLWLTVRARSAKWGSSVARPVAVVPSAV